ncbi:hypothetical protein NUACC26_055450 [Scytonema sp. NUACC26]
MVSQTPHLVPRLCLGMPSLEAPPKVWGNVTLLPVKAAFEHYDGRKGYTHR